MKFLRAQNREAATKWTTLDLYAIAGTAVPQPDGTSIALTKGKIQIESEGTHVYFRRISIQPIAAIPAEIQRLAGLN